jgi:hypothetical protein
MRLSISKLRFSLPEAPIAQYVSRIDAATSEAKELAGASGTHSDKFERADLRIRDSLRQGRSLSSVLQTPVELRALALMFNTDLASRIELSSSVLQKIEEIRSKPGSLLVEAIYSHYLTMYDQRGELTEEGKQLLGGNGPKWLAEESHRQGRDFDEQVRQIGLDRYRSGRLLTVAKNIYYLDVLRKLQPNESHPILDEMQKKSVYDSRHDENSLLGHQILSILVEKAPASGVCDVWLNVVLAIGGDPRVPPSHRNYRKWWSQLDPQLKNKVKGWLPKLDLRLFLEALEDFSNLPHNAELKRMYPARKHFMEGLLNKQLVIGTRLYLSPSAESYLRRTYKLEHLPSYSVVTDRGKSLIHIQLDGAHLVEGSHSCRLWIYEALDPSAIVFDYSKTRVTYSSLTQMLAFRMQEKGLPHKANIRHHPPLGWQNKAIVALQELGVPITSKDALTPEDYRVYKRRYGA